MKIFTVSMEDEDERWIKNALTLIRVERKADPPRQSYATTSPLDRVTFILIEVTIF
jgi:hypothetical protein